MRKHLGIRMYPCDICSKRFTQTSDLLRHKRIHGGVRPFECALCSRRFTRKCTCVNHVQRIHHRTDTADLIYMV